MDKELFEKVHKDFLIKELGMDEKQANRIIKGESKLIKEEERKEEEEQKEQDRKEREKEEKREKKAKLRHGTTCIGVITDGANPQPITEW
jgi:hypothetical protein